MDRNEIFNLREDFFNEIVANISRPPAKIDKILNQDRYYFAPISSETLIDAHNGDLALSFAGQFHQKKFSIMYTFWQIGQRFRIGIALGDEELQDMFELDAHNEIDSIWDDNRATVEVEHGYVFYDWVFDTPDLYSCYLHQEKFVQGIRHMHFRVMKVIHDKCEMLLLLSRQNDLSSDLNLLVSNSLEEKTDKGDNFLNT